MIFKKGINRRFVSQTDKFLHFFDEDHPEKSESQQHEIQKAARVSHMRDTPDYQSSDEASWQGL